MATSELVWSAGSDTHPELDAAALHVVQWSPLGAAGAAPSWQPSVNVYLAASACLVCIELAGVASRSLQLRAEPQRLLIRGRRAPPEPDGCVAKQVLAMEIDHGRFEREIRLPFAVDVGAVQARNDNGLIWVELPLLSGASGGGA